MWIRFLITIIIILLIFWNRFIRVRIPVLIDLYNLSYINKSIILILIVTFIYIIFRNIFILNPSFQIQCRVSHLDYSIFNKFNKYFLLYILDSPRVFYEYFVDRYFTFWSKQIELFTSYLTVYFDYPQLVVVIFKLLPRIFVSTSFLIDVLYLHQLNYFFHALIILIFPLLFICYKHMIQFHCTHTIEYIEHHLTFIPHEKLLEIRLKETSPNIPNALTINEMRAKFQVLVGSWYINTTLSGFIDKVSAFDTKINPYLNIYTSLCYLIGWSFILILVL